MYELVAQWNQWRAENPEVQIDLHGVDLSGMTLPEIDLHGADLRKADMRDCILYKANLSGAECREADMYDSNLDYADFTNADLADAKLEHTNLRYAKLQNTFLQSVRLKGADLRGADLRGANIDYACLPIWCGGQSAIVDARLAKQMLLHALSYVLVSEYRGDADQANVKTWIAIRELARKFCGTSHVSNYMSWPTDTERWCGANKLAEISQLSWVVGKIKPDQCVTIKLGCQSISLPTGMCYMRLPNGRVIRDNLKDVCPSPGVQILVVPEYGDATLVLNAEEFYSIVQHDALVRD